MTFSAVPYALQNASHSAALFRQALSAVVPNNGGLVQYGDLAVAQTATASLQVQVGVGRCFIPGTNLGNLPSTTWSTQGLYFGLNDAAVTLPIGTPDANNPRIDIVVATVNDAFYSGTLNSGALQVVQGVPAATPAAPAVPANSLLLANVAVAANAPSITTSNITNVAVPYDYEHVEFTGTNMSYPSSGAAWGIGPTGNLSIDKANSFNYSTWWGGFIQDGCTLSAAGLYLFELLLTGSTAAPPTMAKNILNSSSGAYVATESVFSGAVSWTTGVVATGFVNAGQNVIFQTASRAAAWTASSRVRITKLG
jgi:hypothetical protein